MYLWKFLCVISFFLRCSLPVIWETFEELRHDSISGCHERIYLRKAVRACTKIVRMKNCMRSRWDTSHKKRDNPSSLITGRTIHEDFRFVDWQIYDIFTSFLWCLKLAQWFHSFFSSPCLNMLIHQEYEMSSLWMIIIKFRGLRHRESSFFLITFVSQHNLHNAVRYRKGAQKSSSIMTRGDGWKIDWKKKSFLDAYLIGNIISYKK